MSALKTDAKRDPLSVAAVILRGEMKRIRGRLGSPAVKCTGAFQRRADNANLRKLLFQQRFGHKITMIGLKSQAVIF